ncbi:type I-E CRISPR-associated protein Cse1/CasA [Bifidobacterium saguinibicoloris]|uniref:type I-E CRISPR-associated protein Cse1/CasA n=1 Tax=Bifidobacterium saguinibicoloris TaxID=2834433 RepID=UPI001C596CD5|nr:type I-E CRISPR-associated protein Cse1/CasA [Bifidobacterium saguinibicoloris]MBW3081499.1 type I-E CRISPR-associated protein Cse1/CasA [Bifidobacterium saguinibicoloris]
MTDDSHVRGFNLLDEPWMPCVFVDGSVRELSIRDVFRDAPRIRSISGDLPQQTVPLERLLLAILYCAYCDPEADRRRMRDLWSGLWGNGTFDMGPLQDYFGEFHDRFYLLDPERPFYQVPDLTYNGKKAYDPISEMIADVPKPDKFLFSMRSPDSLESIGLAQAARWLVFLQAYDTAGIKTPVAGNTHVNKGKVYAPKGMAGTGWMGVLGPVMVEGDNLFHTLMLNWCLYDTNNNMVKMFGNEDDVAPWEFDESSGPDITVRTSFTGPVDALTFQSRRLRLVPNKAGSRIVGIVNCYGDVIAPYNTDECEKMTAWRLSVPQQKKLGLSSPPLMPVTHDAGKALWRGLASMVAVGKADLRPGVVRWVEELQREGCLDEGVHLLSVFSIHAQGMTYGTQSSVYETGIDDVLQLPLAFSRKDYAAIGAAVHVIGKTREAVDVMLANYVHNLRSAAGDRMAGGRSQAASERVREDAYARLDGLFRDRLVGFTPDKDYEIYRDEWLDDVHRMLLVIGSDYLSDSSVSAFDEHDAGRMGMMTAARARLLFLGGLNKTLGRLSADAAVDKKGA